MIFIFGTKILHPLFTRVHISNSLLKFEFLAKKKIQAWGLQKLTRRTLLVPMKLQNHVLEKKTAPSILGIGNLSKTRYMVKKF